MVRQARQYPASRYQPLPLVDLGSREARERLSPAALKAFFKPWRAGSCATKTRGRCSAASRTARSTR